MRRITTLCFRAALPLSLLFGTAQIGIVSAADTSISPGREGSYESIRLALGSSAIVKVPQAFRDVLVGNPDIVDVTVRTKNAAYLFGKSIGQTNIFLLDKDGRRIALIHLEVSKDPEALRQLIKRTMPASKITVDSIAESVVLKGTAENAAEMQTAYDLARQMVDDPKKIVNTVHIRGKEQVALKVRVAEVQRNVLKQLGVDLSAALSIGDIAIDVVSSNAFSLAGSALSKNSLSMGYSSGGDSISAVVKAMERDGLLKTLAEPTLTAVSGESANFLAGGEYPVPVGGSDGETQIEFKKYGVGLGFTPIVLSEGKISLKISTEVSELSSDNAVSINSSSSSSSTTVPGLKVRRAETTVELPSGGSMVMAGLIQQAQKQQIEGTPGLKDVPILGLLFRSRDFQSNETELAVIVTPYIVRPVAENKLALPTDRLASPSDETTILFGRLNKIYGNGSKPPEGKYFGSVGHIND